MDKVIEQYTKKPVTIEAIRLTDDHVSRTNVYNFINGISEPKEPGEFWPYHDFTRWIDDNFPIKTLEGTMRASYGDYIIKGVKGEFYPCKPDIFEMTYSPATPATSWEEVEKEASNEAHRNISKKYPGLDNNTNKYHIFYLEEKVKYLSQHWPSSNKVVINSIHCKCPECGKKYDITPPSNTYICTNSTDIVSPTPMAETWEEAEKKYKEDAFIETLPPQAFKLLSWLKKRYQLSAPSLHQVDRWVRVEDLNIEDLPKHSHKEWRSALVLICDASGWGEGYYNYLNNEWEHGHSAYTAKPTHYKIISLPAAPETDKTT